MRKIYRVIIFLIIFIIIFNNIFSILWINENSISNFYKEEQDSIDVVYIGSSNVYRHFNPTLSYDLYGFTVGLYASDSQPFYLTKYFLEDIKRKQNPKLYVIDLTKLPSEYENYTEENFRKAIDNMPFSINKYNLIKNNFNRIKDVKSSKSGNSIFNYYFSFLMYHNSWKNISIDNYKVENYYKGYYPLKETKNIIKQEWVNDEEELAFENKQSLIDLLEYIKANKLNVIFTIPKRNFSYEDNTKINTATKIIENYKINIINLNTVNDFVIDYSNDMYDDFHLNIYGSTKYTLYFSKYLKENYNLTDHRGDIYIYNSWDSEYKRFKDSFKKLTKKDFDELLQEYEKEY